MITLEFKSYLPDLDPREPGIITSCAGVYPTISGGLRPIPALADLSEALDSACLGIISQFDANRSIRNVAGTETGLYELGTTSWSDVSRSGGYSAQGWRFAVWGEYVLAADLNTSLQVQTSPGLAFSDVSGSPQARYIAVCNDFVILAYVYDTAEHPYRIQWCAKGDYTDWTPSLTTEAGYFDLVGQPGPITGLVAHNNDLYVFKEQAVYLGTYLGPPYVWGFQRISAEGCPSQDAIIATELGIFYWGNTSLWHLEGTTVTNLGTGISNWLFNESYDFNNRDLIKGCWDPKRKLIWWLYPPKNGDGTLTRALIYSPVSNRFTLHSFSNVSIEQVYMHIQPAITYDTFGNLWSTWDDIEGATYHSPLFTSYSYDLAFVSQAHKIQKFDYSNIQPAAFVYGPVLGDRNGLVRVTRIYPKFLEEPDGNVTLVVAGCDVPAGSYTVLNTATYGNGRADLFATGRFLKVGVVFSGSAELRSLDLDLVGRGKR